MNELQLSASANEEIKNVVGIAENISLISVNAMLVAQQAGGMPWALAWWRANCA
jgi:hypothetical protein